MGLRVQTDDGAKVVERVCGSLTGVCFDGCLLHVAVRIDAGFGFKLPWNP